MEFTLTDPGPEPPADAPLHQSPIYGRAMVRLGARVWILRVEDDGACLAQAQVISRRIMGVPLHWIPRGPVWAPGLPLDRQQAVLARLPHATALRGVWLATPDSVEAAASYHHLGYRALLTPQQVAELPLDPDPQVMRSRQHGKWRNRLRRAEGAGLHVSHRPFDTARDAPLLGLETAQREHRRYTDVTPTFVSQWSKAAPMATRLFQLREHGQLRAFMIFLMHGTRATYQIGWRDPDHDLHSAHHMILWHAAKYLAQKGFHQLDLGTIDTETNPGLARFKLGCGACARPLGPSLLRLPCARIPLAIRRAAV
ncbi:GNAT family N-acetyltransferase [Roseovarius sp. A21]|uniref:GNAT family N-acetyltransferase n=1 Tax=Roseovarius bejariae TaxID=2576383 RepID=A0A844D428_9RHOB|nr:GNAT family N-acetyltransferase [Roseovarius bejariae]MRU16934.1 GNAT family N-acetyltransferase [Roseovarius bejariae]